MPTYETDMKGSGIKGSGIKGVRYEGQAVAVADKEKLATWMIRNSFATGHGDTIDDLLTELTWQINELRDARHQIAELQAQIRALTGPVRHID